MMKPKCDNSWYPADIRSISQVCGCWIWRKHGFFQRLAKFYFHYYGSIFTLRPLYTDMWLISTYPIFFWYSAEICQILSWHLVTYPFDIRLIHLWYPAEVFDILISGLQLSRKVLRLDETGGLSYFIPIGCPRPTDIFSQQIYSARHIQTYSARNRDIQPKTKFYSLIVFIKGLIPSQLFLTMQERDQF